MSVPISAWVAGARPATLPAAIAPVLAGLAAAIPITGVSGIKWAVVILAALVALALQVGVNYANDYSDGVRGTDDDRVGPLRLVGSGIVEAGAVKIAAFAAFGVAAVAGVVAVALTGHWWLIAIGVCCILAAWYYTGGKHPYGYLGLGEVMVFIFFGLVATVGTTYLLTDAAPAAAWAAAVAVGVLATALLVVNNLRDLNRDAAAGKRTLATRLGDQGTRRFFVGLIVISALAIIGYSLLVHWYALISLLGLGIVIGPLVRLVRGATGRALIPMLKASSLAELGVAFGLLIGTSLGLS